MPTARSSARRNTPTDRLPILDPKTHTVTYLQGAGARCGHAGGARPWPCRDREADCSRRPIGATRSCGTPKPTTTTPCSIEKGRLWLAAAVRGPNNPDFCKKGSDHPSAKLFPIEKNVRQLAVLDPKTMKYTFVDTCFGSHHLQFGYDANDTLWTSGGGPVAGWLEHQEVRRDRRCWRLAGLVAVRARHQRQRQARRLHRAESAGRSAARTCASPAARAPMR